MGAAHTRWEGMGGERGCGDDGGGGGKTMKARRGMQGSAQSLTQRVFVLNPPHCPQSSGGSRHLVSVPISTRSVCAIDAHARRASACRAASREPSAPEQFAPAAELEGTPAEGLRAPEAPENPLKLLANCALIWCKTCLALQLGKLRI